jgi:hypothetical protein
MRFLTPREDDIFELDKYVLNVHVIKNPIFGLQQLFSENLDMCHQSQ